MKMIFKNETMPFIDFIEDSKCKQTALDIIYDNKKMNSENHILYYAFKVEMYGTIDVIFIDRAYKVSNNSESLLVNTDGCYSNLIISYDRLNKTCIMFDTDIENVLKLVNDDFRNNYKVYTANDLVDEINKKYNTKIAEILDENFEYYMNNIIEFNHEYNVGYENISYVENKYLQNENIKFNTYDATLDSFTESDIFNLHAYLLDSSVIDKCAIDFVKDTTEQFIPGNLLNRYARYKAYDNLVDHWKKHPTDRMLKVKAIQEAITKGGKTLTVITKDNKTYKVENKLCGAKSFRILNKNYYINIEDISQIIFNKKVLIELE